MSDFTEDDMEAAYKAIDRWFQTQEIGGEGERHERDIRMLLMLLVRRAVIYHAPEHWDTVEQYVAKTIKDGFAHYRTLLKEGKMS